MPTPKPPSPEKKPLEQTRDWVKYTGLGFQMIGTIVAFTFAGIYADEYFGFDSLFTIILSLIGVAGGLYVALKDFL